MPEATLVSSGLGTGLPGLLASLLAGVALGLFFFGGLWWTTRRAATAAQPALWLLASLVLRMGGVLLGFHLAGGGQWPRLLACLAGFVLARVLVLRQTRQAPGPPAPAATPEGRHAP